MRLINCSTLKLEEFVDREFPRYAILSHTWEKEEVSFADFTHDEAVASRKAGYQKIALTCKQALQDNIAYAWVDTCCIDKSSSAELSEAINSMFKWYQNAAVCYAYLSDVSSADFDTSFPRSRWFRRGWTLQELLAPENLTFYDQEWTTLGTKSDHVKAIHKITTIDVAALCGSKTRDSYGGSLGSFCIAKRICWASSRTTTREEDRAYSLLGILDVNLPLVYGEGSQAFRRLQEEIIRKHGDNSILAWGTHRPPALTMEEIVSSLTNPSAWRSKMSFPLADSPENFSMCWDLEGVASSDSAFTTTHIGLHLELPIVELIANSNTIGWLGLLNCSPEPDCTLVAIVLKGPHRPSPHDTEAMMQPIMLQRGPRLYRTLLVDPKLAVDAVIRTVILKHETCMTRVERDPRTHIVFRPSDTLRRFGYHVPSEDSGTKLIPSRVGFGTSKQENREIALNFPRLYGSGKLEYITLHSKSSSITRFFPTSFELPVFTVFVSHGSSKPIAIVRLGGNHLYNSVSDIEAERHLEKRIEDDDLIVIRWEEISYRIKVDVVAKQIYHWYMLRVTVDAVCLHVDSEQPMSL